MSNKVILKYSKNPVHEEKLATSSHLSTYDSEVLSNSKNSNVHNALIQSKGRPLYNSTALRNLWNNEHLSDTHRKDIMDDIALQNDVAGFAASAKHQEYLHTKNDPSIHRRLAENPNLNEKTSHELHKKNDWFINNSLSVRNPNTSM